MLVQLYLRHTMDKGLSMTQLSLATEIRDGIYHQSKKVNKIEEQYGGESDENVQDIKQSLDKIWKNADDLINEIIKTRKDVDELIEVIENVGKRLQALEIENASLKERIEKLEKDKSLLLARELAYHFEENLARYIYPKHAQYSTICIFSSLQDWLHENRLSSEGKKPNKDWKDITSMFEWLPKHEHMFKKFIAGGVAVAHPKINWRTDELEIPPIFTDEEKECLQKMFLMTKHLHKVIRYKKY